MLIKNYIDEIMVPTPTVENILQEFGYLFVDDFGSWSNEANDTEDEWTEDSNNDYEEDEGND